MPTKEIALRATRQYVFSIWHTTRELFDAKVLLATTSGIQPCIYHNIDTHDIFPVVSPTKMYIYYNY